MPAQLQEPSSPPPICDLEGGPAQAPNVALRLPDLQAVVSRADPADALRRGHRRRAATLRRTNDGADPTDQLGLTCHG